MEKTKKEGKNYLDEIKQAYDFMTKNNLDVIEFSDGDDYIKLVKKSASAQNIQILTTSQSVAGIQPTQSQSKPVQEIVGLTIKAPMSGIFYRSSTPSSPPYIREGDSVEANSVICLIEAMKVFNEIKSEFKCKIVKCVADNGKFVNEGENLFVIEKI
jgi:acetyl-CoA carboxylase biotin carboxyl carrier protein